MAEAKGKDKAKDSEGKISEIAKKLVSIGIGAAFMTEETVKNVLQDVPLPKDMVAGLLDNAKSTKEEFVGSVKNELRRYLNAFDISKEVDRVIEKYDFEVKISLKKKEK